MQRVVLRILIVLCTIVIHSLGFRIQNCARVDMRLKAGSSEEVVGVIVVDHGSRKAESNERLKQLVSDYKDLSQLSLVEPAHMELSEPSIATAYRRCVEQGATRVVCFPFFLSPGRPVQEGIPTLLEEAAAQNPGIPYAITDPLGMHKSVLTIIEDTVSREIHQ